MPPDLVIGVDPGRRSGLAWGIRGTRPSVVALPMRSASSHPELQALADLARRTPAIAVVERSSCQNRRFVAHRFAAQEWALLLREVGIHHVEMVDVRVWQGAVLAGCPGRTAKDRSLWHALNVCGIDVGKDTEMADALALRRYAASLRCER